MLTRGAQEDGQRTVRQWAPRLASRMVWIAAALAIGVTTTWLWKQTRSLVPQEHARIDSALRELRSLDRTVNQDVLQARFKIIDNYDPVRRSYRRIEQLEAVISVLPRFLSGDDRRRMADAVARYRAAVTDKERLIEDFKYGTLNLNELLAYLPGAATGMAKAASNSSDEALAHAVNQVLQLTLLYNLTSDDEYPPVIRREVDALELGGRKAKSYLVRQRVRTLALNIRTLLAVKPRVDGALARILTQPIALREDDVASVYYPAHSSAELRASRYRVLLFSLCTGILALMAYGVLRMRRGAAALAASKERLEARVIERTYELDVRNRELRTVLDNVGQALFTVDLTGQLSNERSAALDLWFPGASPGTHLATLFGAIDSAAGDWIAAGWEQVQAGLLPVEVALDQLPSKLVFRGHHYGVEYRTIHGASGLEKILVVISDVTEGIERSRAETDQREQLAIFEHVMNSRAELLEFFAECERLVQIVLTEPPGDRSSLLRAIHTLKGNAAMRGIDSLASVCHALEEKLSQPAENLELPDRAALTAVWSVFAARVGKFTQAVPADRLELTRGDLESVRAALAAGESAEAVIDRLWALEQEPAGHRLERVAEDARVLARRLGRDGLTVTVESDDLRFERKRWAPFWSAFIHVLRNAIDHGIEPPDERVARGKPRAGRLSLRAGHSGDEVAIEIGDDGRGIDWQAVRARAQDLGRPADSEAKLLEELFTGGISTRQAVSEISGRGAGMSACKAACDALGGQISVATQLGQGTTFRFTFPTEADLPQVSPIPGTGSAELATGARAGSSVPARRPNADEPSP